MTWFIEVDPEAAESATSCQSYWARRSPTVRKIAEKTIWFTCIARNAIIVVICLFIAYLIDGPDLDPAAETTFKLTGAESEPLNPAHIFLTEYFSRLSS